MTCYHPIKAYRSKTLTATGKRQLVFKESQSNGESLEIPCGQCIACRLDKSLDWAIRISHEASLYDHNCFITLTYSPENLPPGGSLVVSHYQLFMKRLRKRFGKNIRFFHCGEYGEKLGRPHYHACLLNFDFPDKVHFKTTDRGDRIYRSQALEELWPFGHSEIGTVTFESAAYVARYITKKITGTLAQSHYTCVDVETGEVIQRKPEYTTMSRRPGIGAPWLKKFKTDVYNYDQVLMKGGHSRKPPRFYDNQYEIIDPVGHRRTLLKREANQLSSLHDRDAWIRRERDNTYERRIVRETVHKATVESSLKRKM